jgi:hypothetical protein
MNTAQPNLLPPAPRRRRMSAKPNADGANERLWTLFQLAFARLIRPRRRSPASRYDECDEFEAAQEIAHLAMTMAVAADAKWQAFEQRNPRSVRARGRSKSRSADDGEAGAR